MIEVEYGEQEYVQGKHVDDCPSQQPSAPPRVEGDVVILDLYLCSGCLPLPARDTSA